MATIKRAIAALAQARGILAELPKRNVASCATQCKRCSQATALSGLAIA